MFKLILLLLLLAFACAAAMALLARLSRISSQLRDLHGEVERKNRELDGRVAQLNETQLNEQGARRDKSERIDV
jgi:hypothetical protein